jgi:hypothetical protein
MDAGAVSHGEVGDGGHLAVADGSVAFVMTMTAASVLETVV